MDEDPDEERPKLVQHCDVVKLQQKRGEPDGRQWKNTILGTPLNSSGLKRRGVEKVAIANGTWKTAANALHHCQIEFGAGFIVSSNIPNNE